MYSEETKDNLKSCTFSKVTQYFNPQGKTNLLATALFLFPKPENKQTGSVGGRNIFFNEHIFRNSNKWSLN